jgi:hypothetical protein
MKSYEDQVVGFLKPFFKGDQTERALDRSEQNYLAGWIALIVLLAEYAESHHPTIRRPTLAFLKNNRVPPGNFKIYLARSGGKKWKKYYQYHSFFLKDNVSPLEVPLAPDGRPFVNTQISTLGIGGLVIHAFSGPANSLFEGYCSAVEHSEELDRLWPPRKTFWLRKYRPSKFPPSHELSDGEVNTLADAFLQKARKWNRKHFG